MATEELDVPEEVRELFDEVVACNQCRDVCIRSVFKAKRAIYYAKKAVRANVIAWHKVRELWPQTEKGAWQYSVDTFKVTRLPEPNKEVRGAEQASPAERPS